MTPEQIVDRHFADACDLARQHARKTGCDPDQAESDALKALWDAARSFDASQTYDANGVWVHVLTRIKGQFGETARFDPLVGDTRKLKAKGIETPQRTALDGIGQVAAVGSPTIERVRTISLERAAERIGCHSFELSRLMRMHDVDGVVYQPRDDDGPPRWTVADYAVETLRSLVKSARRRRFRGPSPAWKGEPWMDRASVDAMFRKGAERVTPAELASVLEVETATIFRRVGAGELPEPIGLGRTLHWPRAVLVDHLWARQQQREGRRRKTYQAQRKAKKDAASPANSSAADGASEGARPAVGVRKRVRPALAAAAADGAP